MRVITRNEMAWDISRAQYVTVYQESYDFGHTDVDECKGGGAKGIIGLIGSIAIPFAAPLIASSLVTSSIIAASSQVFASTLIGAGLGGALGLATGGLKGGLLGAIGGGAGGYFNAGFGSGAGAGAGAGVGVPAVGESPGAAAGLSTNIPGSGVAAFTDGGAASVSAPLAGDFSSGVSGGLGSATSSFVEGTPLLGATSNGSVAGFLNGGTGGGTAAASNGIFDNLNPDLKQAGIKLGAQAIGNALTPTPTGAGLQSQADYLNRAQAQGDKVLGLNITQNDARNKDASAVETIAANYDPQYLGNNAATASKNRDNATWAETEARLRTAGYSDQAIASERNRFDTMSSQNTGTAYTGGVSQGIQQQAGLYTEGANIRQNYSAPDAGLSSAYQNLASQYTAKKTAAGNAIQDAFGAVLPSTTIGAKKTTNTNIDPTTVAQ